ncbi:MAG: PD40 domain-containing protein, partial [Solirubrobacterales bacterium]|nr:PD40 domain-containing protein [Solirubrobacterales bacterium]
MSRYSSSLVLVAAMLVASLVSAAGAAAQLPTTTRASVSSTGAEATSGSLQTSVSANGRLVAFYSSSPNLVPADTNGTSDVFLRDRATGVTRRLSVGPAGVQANASSFDVSMTADGRIVLFRSGATNLVAGVPAFQLYLADTTTGEVRRALVPPATHGNPYDPSISADGSRIVFVANRVSGGTPDVFAADVGTGAVRRISETAAGSAGNARSYEPDVSGDGRWVAFTTDASNLVTPDINGFRDIILVDLQTGVLQRASVGSGSPGAESNLHSSDAALSRDGCIVAFRSDAGNLVAPDAGSSVTEIFARDRCTAQTEVVSVTNSGVAGTGFVPDVSDDGCLIVYRSRNVSPAPSGHEAAVLRDRCAGVTSRLDLSTTGEPGNNDVADVQIAAGTGRYVALSSFANNLVPGDANTSYDAFVRDRAVNTRPVAELTLTQEGRRITADALASRDPDGPTVSGRIAWGDGAPDDTGLQAQHEYARGGSYSVTVTVTDADGATTTKSAVAVIPDPPIAPPPPTGSGGTAPGGGTAEAPVAVPPLVLDRVSLSRRSFAPVARGGRPGGKRGATLT